MAKVISKNVLREVVSTVSEVEYVLTLTEKEAELLGSIRYHDVPSTADLYSILYGLPRGDHSVEFARSQFVSGLRRNDLYEQIKSLQKREAELIGEVGRLQEALVVAQMADSSIADRVTSDAPLRMRATDLFDWHATAETEVTPEPKWKIQCRYRGMYGYEWETVQLPGSPFLSRNAAYRAMRGREVRFKGLEYRVVPADQKDVAEPEEQRGKYVVEMRQRGTLRWVPSGYVSGYFESTDDARQSIERNGTPSTRYRVKWVP